MLAKILLKYYRKHVSTRESDLITYMSSTKTMIEACALCPEGGRIMSSSHVPESSIYYIAYLEYLEYLQYLHYLEYLEYLQYLEYLE